MKKHITAMVGLLVTGVALSAAEPLRYAVS